jgi:hypothetical protein
MIVSGLFISFFGYAKVSFWRSWKSGSFNLFDSSAAEVTPPWADLSRSIFRLCADKNREFSSGQIQDFPRRLADRVGMIIGTSPRKGLPMSDWMSSSQVAELFAEEIAGAGGKVTETFDDADRVFTRGVMPPSIEVGPQDHLKGGVALCATDTDIFVHPYVFRLVCSNGAIVAQATQTHRLARDDHAVMLESALRFAIRCCCDRDAFVSAAGEMRASQNFAANRAIAMSAFMSSHGGRMPKMMLVEIFRRYEADGDRSAYGLMNAVTSLARDTRDPELKWRLEKFGGGIPALMQRAEGTPKRTRIIERDLVEVG